MVNYEYKIIELEKKFGLMDSQELIKEIKLITEDPQVEFKVKSKGLRLIGDIICNLSPDLEDDIGYSYFKMALEFDQNNYDAMLGICSIFNTYPYPYNTIVTEVEYLSNIEKLISNFEILEKKQKFNLLQSIKVYLTFRKKIINKYGYSSKRND